jgi:SAM-dependent methyltransferase
VPLIVDDSHFAYLKLQRGRIEALASDRAAWLEAYARTLDEDLASIEPHLPATCRNLLDVGSGLGGIDVLLNRHYLATTGNPLEVALLDGIDDMPEVSFHDRTYNDMAVAIDFLVKNGVEHCYFVPLPPREAKPFDLIISLQSWCFHYPPAAYLEFVKGCVHRDSVLILDVRADKPLWRDELRQSFTEVAVALSRPKFNRLVFHVQR